MLVQSKVETILKQQFSIFVKSEMGENLKYRVAVRVRNVVILFQSRRVLKVREIVDCLD